MKKFLAIVAALAIVFVMAVPVLAADDSAPSVTADDLVIKITPNNEKPSDADVGSGNKVLGGYSVTLVHSETGAEATAEEIEAYIKAQGGSIEIDFSSVLGDVNPTKVLQKIGGSWQPVSFSGAKVTVSSLDAIALIVKDSERNGGAPAGKKTSPQTGYDTVLWSIAAAAMVVCAGYCFVSARKNTAE